MSAYLNATRAEPSYHVAWSNLGRIYEDQGLASLALQSYRRTRSLAAAGTSDGVELETQEKTLLVEWFANNYKNFGAALEFVTNRSQEGSQFVKGFGGIGGILRYKVDFMEHDYDFEDDEEEGMGY